MKKKKEFKESTIAQYKKTNMNTKGHTYLNVYTYRERGKRYIDIRII